MSIFIIAEIGINHNGDIEIAKKLIDVAKECGCDAVKFQKRTIDIVYPKEVLDAPRESPWGTTNRDQKMHLEFGQKEYEIIDSYCKEKQIEWFASAWDYKSLEFIRQFSLKYNKIASAMIVDLDFLKEVASEKKHTLISTGLSEIEDVDKAVEIFRKAGCPFELMHCVGTYPMNEEQANLNMIGTLKKRYNCPVGYSGHEPGLAVSYAAASLGISSLERHITIDRTMYGSDQAASIEPNGLRTLIGSIRKIQKAFGDGVKRFLPEEKAVAKKLRVHLPLKK
ncbi:MAG TPA: N-acetylneuraminate synthase [Lentisphaeria bacterium]|nr:MAG: N-acetylneuraminate synthase [Lentisphaerae bacterium GWF2_50_93]HCE45354.1 N-acetylneuraminate synthase [Lentisphaeria bacterium]